MSSSSIKKIDPPLWAISTLIGLSVLFFHIRALTFAPIDAYALSLPMPIWATAAGSIPAFLALLLYAVASICVFVLAFNRLKINKVGSIFAGLLFAMHPASTQALFWADARMVVVLSSMMVIATTAMFVQPSGLSATAKGRIKIAAIIFGVLSIIFMPILIFLPLGIMLFPNPSKDASNSRTQLFALITSVVLLHISLVWPLSTAGALLGFGIVQSVWMNLIPTHHMSDYTLLFATSATGLAVFATTALVLAILISIIAKKRFPRFTSALAWFTLAGTVSASSHMGADHASTVALVAVCILFALLVNYMGDKLGQWAGVSLAVVILIVYMIPSLFLQSTWKSEIAQIEHLAEIPIGGKLELARRLAVRGERQKNLSASLKRRARVYRKEGRENEADDLLLRANQKYKLAQRFFAIANKSVYEAKDYYGADSIEVLELDGIVAWHLLQYDRATRSLKSALLKSRAGDKRSNLHFYYGRVLERKGKNIEAIAEYQLAIKENPQNADAHKMLALAFAARGHISRALIELKKACELRLEDAQLWNQCGHIYEDLLDFESAELAYAHATKAEPQNESYRGDLDAVRALLKTKSRNPELARKAFNIAEGFAIQEKYYAAAEHYKNAIAYSPAYHIAHFKRGLMLVFLATKADMLQDKASFRKQAKEHFEAAITLDPKNEDYQLALAQIQLDMGQSEEAKKTLEKIKESNPGSGIACHRLAEIYAIIDQDLNSAKEELSRAEQLSYQPRRNLLDAIFDLELGPQAEAEVKARDKYEQLMSESELFLFMENVDEALNSVRSAYDILGKYERKSLLRLRAHTAARIARCMVIKKDLAAAVDWLERANKLSGNDDFRHEIKAIKSRIEKKENK